MRIGRLLNILALITILIAPSEILAQREVKGFETSPRWQRILSTIHLAKKLNDLPAPKLFQEPTFTQGTANDIWFQIPPIENLPDSIRANIDLYVVLRDVWVETSSGPVPILIEDPNDTSPRSDRASGLTAQTYNYAVRIFIVDKNGNEFISSFSDTVSSTQDIRPPISDNVMISQRMPPFLGWLSQSSLNIQGELFDQAGISQGTLYHRRARGSSWQVVGSITFEGLLTAEGFVFSDSEPVVFDLDSLADGLHQFRIAGTDASHTPQSPFPEFVVAGNSGVPGPDAMAQDSIRIDTTPPDSVTVSCAQDLNCIELEWTEAGDDGIGVMGYFIFRDGELIDTVDGNQRSYQDCFSEDTPTTVFHYQVQPFDSLQNVQRLGGERLCEFRGVPDIAMVPEPNVTKGTSNTVCWSPSDDIFVSYTVYIASNCDEAPTDSLQVNDTNMTCAAFTGLANGEDYCYRVRGLDKFGRVVVSDRVESTQDASPPVSMAAPLPDCFNAEVVVPFSVWDELSASIDSVRLYFRHEPVGEWLSATNLVKDVAENLVASSLHVSLADSIGFTAAQDGYVEFYVAGKDTARAPDARPGDDLSDAEGNWDMPQPSTPEQSFTYVDTQEPESEVTDLDSVQKSLCFRVPYHADDIPKDGYESGLSKVTLCYRFEEEDEVVRCDSVQIFNGNADAVDSFFLFTASKGDGRYTFFTEATDACGNAQTVTAEPIVTEVRGTPQITQISPSHESFNFADSVAVIEFTFDRRVLPIGDYADAFQIINRYKRDRQLMCQFDTLSLSEDLFKVICRPDSIEAAGFFEVRVDKGQIAFSTECDTLPAITEEFAFYTYMEAGQGGQIAMDEVTLSVPSGHPAENVVIIFEPTEALCTPTGFELASDQCLAITSYLDRIGGTTLADIPGWLCQGYSSPLASGADPATVRVFEQIGGRCRPAGDSRTWEVDLSTQLACTYLDDIIDAFCVFGQSSDLLTQQKKLGNYPNPLSTDGTTITYLLEEAGAEVSIRIFDLFGNLVKTFTNVTSNEGLNTCPWNGLNDMGEEAANGGYICVMVVNGKEKYRRKIGVMR